MTLSLVGPQSIEELSRMAIEYFSGVEAAPLSSLPSIVIPNLDKVGGPLPSESSSANRAAAYPLQQENEGTVIRIRPVKDSVKRTAGGIWKCRAKTCGKTIAGGCWQLTTTAAATVKTSVARLRKLNAETQN